ncbi:hypothetical protein [Endozoicomonas sp. 8E]|uniref:hypothetical protein n=1 Tax=Endozoicomonas sp. 8E TaxID=3035692 RepID=UPI0029390088|nr:hypothetical protein [Endozoicomonas sp. 8E]WOG28478.1 hypothetical protein P6910_02145 [Endozoicomonas sp. 8E]
MPDLCCGSVFAGVVIDKEQIAGEIDPAQQLSISFRTSFSWKQKIAFPLTGIKADQSRVRDISSWQDNTPIS